MSERTLLLGIDTSSEGDLVLAQLHGDGSFQQVAAQQFSSRNQSTELFPKLRLVLEAAGAKLIDLAAIVVVHGPGSFTGLRIGISAAKGLAEACGAPLLAISSLEVLGHGHDRGTVCILNAGRVEYYVRIGSQDENRALETIEQEAAAVALTENKMVVVADAKLVAIFPRASAITIGQVGAWQALLAALPRFRSGDFESAATLDANYVRRPYTEMAKLTG